MRSVEQADNGEWCVVEDGRWFPFGSELSAFQTCNLNWELFKSNYMFYRNGKSVGGVTSKTIEQTEQQDKYADYLNLSDIKKTPEANDPKPAGNGSVSYTMTTKYYDQKAIQNLKAGFVVGKSLNFYTYAPMPPQYAVITEPAPEPPKKAMPKAVPDTNGRKFRDEE